MEIFETILCRALHLGNSPSFLEVSRHQGYSDHVILLAMRARSGRAISGEVKCLRNTKTASLHLISPSVLFYERGSARNEDGWMNEVNALSSSHTLSHRSFPLEKARRMQVRSLHSYKP